MNCELWETHTAWGKNRRTRWQPEVSDPFRLVFRESDLCECRRLFREHKYDEQSGAALCPGIGEATEVRPALDSGRQQTFVSWWTTDTWN